MKCERCQSETNTSYSFYYGEKTAKSVRTRKTAAKEYLPKPAQEVFLCDSCVTRTKRIQALQYIITAVVLGAILYGLGILFNFTNEDFYSFFCVIVPIGIAILGIVAGIDQGISNRPDNRKMAGESLAIQLRKSTLEKQGNDKFWTSAEFDKLHAFVATRIVNPQIPDYCVRCDAPLPVPEVGYSRHAHYNVLVSDPLSSIMGVKTTYGTATVPAREVDFKAEFCLCEKCRGQEEPKVGYW